MVNIFKNIKEAHKFFKFPGSYRVGTLIKNDFVIRIYSNGVAAPDYFTHKNKYFYYIIKSQKILDSFKNNKINNKSIHLFTRNLETKNVHYYGKYKIRGFRKENKYVLLEKI